MSSNPDNKGRGSNEDSRTMRAMSSKSPDRSWSKPAQLTTPGINHDVWKRYTDSRLRAFGAR